MLSEPCNAACANCASFWAMFGLAWPPIIGMSIFAVYMLFFFEPRIELDWRTLRVAAPLKTGGSASIPVIGFGWYISQNPEKSSYWCWFALAVLVWAAFIAIVWAHDYHRSMPSVAVRIEYLTYAQKNASNPHKIVLARLVFTNVAKGPNSLAGAVHRLQLFVDKDHRIGEATFVGDELREFPHMNATPQDIVTHKKATLVNMSMTTEIQADGMVPKFALGRVDDPDVTEEQLRHIRVHFENQRGQSIWSQEVGEAHQGKFEGEILTGEE